MNLSEKWGIVVLAVSGNYVLEYKGISNIFMQFKNKVLPKSIRNKNRLLK